LECIVVEETPELWGGRIVKYILKYKAIYLLCFISLLIMSGCADSDIPYKDGSSDSETIKSDDAFVLFVGSSWSNIIFAHQTHSDRENSDCFICHDHGASIGDSKWNCGACHTASDPESLCEQDDDHGCIMAQCDFCHTQRVGSSPNAPAIDCSGDAGDTACCLACHNGGQIASAGVLLDSAVQGVRYQTKTISNKTDAQGTFLYQDGEMVTFSIADLILGKTLGGPIRTIVDLVEDADSATHPTVTNICKLLITLDQDGNPDNGITLTESIIDEVKGRTIDFEQSIDDFNNDPVVQGLIDTLNAQQVFTANTPRSLCSTMEAQTHMSGTLADINFPPLVTFPGAIQVSGSNGCNTAGCHSQAISVNGTYQVDETHYAGGIFNGKPVYKHAADDYWIHWNTQSDVDEWKLSVNTNRRSNNHHYTWSEMGGENDYPPLGGWPSGCATFDGKQITAVVSPLGGISGTLWIGEQVTGSYHYFDHEGDAEAGSTLQWYRCDDTAGTNDVIITGAGSANYTIVDDDLNKYLRLGVTPVSASGSTMGTEIKSGPAGPIVLNAAPIATQVSISGAANVNAILNGSYTYTDAMGDTESGTSFQWYRYADGAGSDEALIAGANALTYTLGDDDFGKYVKFEVTPGAATGNTPGTSVKSSIFGPIEPDPLNQVPSASVPTLSGTGGCVCVNSELTLSYTYSDAENDPESSSYQWYIESTAGSGNFEAISGATTMRWTVSDDCDEGKYIQVEVTPRATMGNSPGTVVVSSPVQIQTDPNNQAPVVSGVSIQTPVYAESQAVGSYSFNDTEGNADVSTFQWYLADTEAGTYTSISGATAYIFVPPDGSFEGKYLKLIVTPRSECGNTPGVAVESSAVQILPSLGNAYPVVSNVAIGGTARVAETLSAQYVFTDADLDSDCSTLQWYFSATQAGVYTAISGATSTSFTAPDNGVYEDGYLKVGVTPIACTGNNYTVPTEVLSDSFGSLDYAQSNQLPVASTVYIDTPVQVNVEANAHYTFSDPELSPEADTGSSYQWYWCATENGPYSSIGGATYTTFTPTGNIWEGRFIKFSITPISEWGNNPGVTVESEPVEVMFDPNNAFPMAIMPDGIKVTLSETTGLNGIYQIDNNYLNGQFNGRPIYKHESNNFWICFSGEWHWIIVVDPQATDWSEYSIINDPENYIIHYFNSTSPSPPLWYWASPDAERDIESAITAACVTVNSGISGEYNRIFETEEVMSGTPGVMPVGTPYNPWTTGVELTATWQYYDAESDPVSSGQTAYQWYRCNESGTSCSQISNATSQSYTPNNDDLGNYLKFTVTPAALTGNPQGQYAESLIVGPVTQTTVYAGEIHQRPGDCTWCSSDVDYWTFYINQTSDVIIDARSLEPCGRRTMPNDYFGNGAFVNRVNTQLVLFPSDAAGNIDPFASGSVSGPHPDGHDTITGESSGYLALDGAEALSPGYYTIAVGGCSLSEDNAKNNNNPVGCYADEVWETNYYHIFLTIGP
jgi:hypothetical protein